VRDGAKIKLLFTPVKIAKQKTVWLFLLQKKIKMTLFFAKNKNFSKKRAGREGLRLEFLFRGAMFLIFLRIHFIQKIFSEKKYGNKIFSNKQKLFFET